MIDFSRYDNLLDIDDLNLESNLTSLSNLDINKLKAVNAIQVKEHTLLEGNMDYAFRKFLSFSREEHNVYFVFVEDYPQAKSRIRSRKGLLYEHRLQLEKGIFLVNEVELTPNESLFAGIVRVTDKNFDYLIHHLNDLPFAFGLLSPYRHRTFTTNRKDFLNTVVLEGLKPGKIYWKNWLKIAALLVAPGKKFFSLQNLNDTEYLRIFYHQADVDWESSLRDFIVQKLQPGPLLMN